MTRREITPESGGVLFYLRTPRVTVEYTNELWNGRPVRTIVTFDRGPAFTPAFTPPVKRHFWERGR